MREVNKTIVSYIAPSVASLLVTFLYIAVDCIFVGRGVGGDALAAVNLALPFAALLTSLAALVAMGGASIAAIRLGRLDVRGAGEAASSSVAFTLIMTLVMTAVGMAFPDAIAVASGSSERLVPLTSEYIYYYSAFIVFSLLGICLSTFIRNDGRPGLAFWGMIAGAIANIALGWLFIFPFGMGIKGAAIASGIGQILAVVILATHFFHPSAKLRLRLRGIDLRLTGKILLRGVPEFITQLSQPVTILCFNIVVMRQVGDIGVAAYAIICNLTSLMFAVQVGVANGMQPLFGRSYGEKNRPLTRYLLKAGVVVNLCATLLIYSLLWLWRGEIVSLFTTDAELTAIAARGLSLYCLAPILAAFNILATAFFLSTKRSGWAMAIAAARGCVLNVLLIMGGTAFFAGDAIWLPLVAVEALTMILGIVLVRHSLRQRNPDSIVLRMNRNAA